MLSCKESTHLISATQDRPLTVAEKLGLRMHLLICTGCRRYRRQIDFLQQACRLHPASPGKERTPETPAEG